MERTPDSSFYTDIDNDDAQVLAVDETHPLPQEPQGPHGPERQVPFELCPKCSAEMLTTLIPREEALHYFYNHCHGGKGLFCPTNNGVRGESGSPTWPTDRGRKIVTILPGNRYDPTKSIDGHLVKAVYEVQTATGQKVRLYDKTGEAGPYAAGYLNLMGRMQEMYPLHPPVELVIDDHASVQRLSNKFDGTDNMEGKLGAVSAVSVLNLSRSAGQPDKVTRSIFVSNRELGRDISHNDSAMPSSESGDTTDGHYNLSHEFGHQVEYATHLNLTTGALKTSPGLRVPGVHESLSRYGKSSDREGYAEAFAEWHLTNGHTSNYAARVLARTEGWYGDDNGLHSSGQLVTDSELVPPGKIASEIQALLGDDFEKGQTIIGNVHSVEPSEEEVVSAMKAVEDLAENQKDPLPQQPEIVGPDLFSMVDLRLIPGEDGHYHWDSSVELYNHCHGSEDGKFCEGNGGGGEVTGKGALPDKDGHTSARAKAKGTGTGGVGSGTGPVKTGPRGGSLVDPHNGTVTFDGVRGYDKNGKPVPGTDAWLEAHGVDRKTFNTRPYVKYEGSKTDPALHEAYKDLPRADKFFKRTAEQTGQDGGYIMYKTPVPGSPYGAIAPQARPNKDLVTNPAIQAQKQTAYNNNLARLEVLKGTTGTQLIRERKERVKQAELNLERTKTATPELIRKEAADNLSKAEAHLKQAKESGSQTELLEAKKNYISVQRASIKDERRANNWNPEKEHYDAETSVKWAKARLERAQADPKAALEAEIKTQTSTIKRSKNALDKTAAKYIFAPGTNPARIDMNPDPQNVKNLTQGKGRIYFAMEGSIKADAILHSIKREDPTAAVVNVPSVTLWQEKGGAAGELKWFAEHPGKGREIVLIPDADGIVNPSVMQQAKAMSAALKTFGAGRVILAAPPPKSGTRLVIDEFNLPSGKGEKRKGIDDHLGAGRGTLAQLQYTTNVKYPSYDLSWAVKATAKEKGGTGININSIPNTEKALAAISGIVGPEGTSRITKKILAQASGLPATSAKEARDRLVKLGVISVEHIFDEEALSRGKRIRNPKVSDERVAELVNRGIIKEPRLDQPFTEVTFDESPIITLRDPRYLIKHSDVSTGTLADLKTWKPPASYKGWTSSVTGKPDTTGIAARQVEGHRKATAKQSANKDVVKQAKKAADQRSVQERKTAAPGRRLVRTKAGSERYGVPIGSPVPLLAAGLPGLISLTLLPEFSGPEPGRTEEFYNSCHGEDGKFCPTGGSGGWGSGKAVPGKGSSGKRVAEKKPSKAAKVVIKVLSDVLTDTLDQIGTSKTDPSTKATAKSSISGKAVVVPMRPSTKAAGSKPWPKSSGRPVTTISEKRFGFETVDGVKTKGVYEVTAANGNKIRLYDKTGKAGAYAADLLNNHAKMNEMYPLTPTRNIIVGSFGKHSTGVFAFVHSHNRFTYVNSDRLGYDAGKLAAINWFMPSAATGNTTNHDYILTHEYGHHVDFARNFVNGNYIRHPLINNREFQTHISRYGNVGATDTHRSTESYAEAFAEWHHSNGTTKNPAAIALARSEKWYGTTGARKTLAASGSWDRADIASWYNPLLGMVAANLTHFSQDESVSKLFSFVIGDGNAEGESEAELSPELPVAGKGEIAVADDFESGKATITGDFKDEESSKEAVATADKIMEDVLSELKEENNG